MARHPKTHPTLEDAYTGPGPLGYWGEWVAYCPPCAARLFGPLPDPHAPRVDRDAALIASGGQDTRDTIRPFWPAEVADEDDVVLCDQCLAWIYDHVADWSKR